MGIMVLPSNKRLRQSKYTHVNGGVNKPGVPYGITSRVKHRFLTPHCGNCYNKIMTPAVPIKLVVYSRAKAGKVPAKNWVEIDFDKTLSNNASLLNKDIFTVSLNSKKGVTYKDKATLFNG